MVALGESDKAMGALEGGYAHADGALMLLNMEPRFDPLRANPRFQRLIHLAGYSAVDPVSIARFRAIPNLDGLVFAQWKRRDPTELVVRPNQKFPSSDAHNPANAHRRLQSPAALEVFRADTNHPTGIANGPAAFEVARAPA
jgi:hypothetical protein